MRHVTLLAAAFAMVFASVAGAAEKLTVYTYESFVAEWGPGPAIKTAFEAECGCELDWVGIADGVALLNRLKIEGANTKADVVLGLDTNLIVEAKQTGLFAPHDTDLSRLELPIEWRNDTFVPYDFAHFAIVYDREKIANPPKSLKELVEGDAEQKLIIQDPRTSTPGLGFLLWMKSVYGDGAKAAWARLKPRILTVTPGWSEAYGLFTKGEAPLVVSYTTSPAYHMIAEKSRRYAAAAFSEGHYLQIEVAGRLAGSAHAELARKFLDFMTRPGFQDQIPTRNWMVPAGEISGSLPPEFGELVDPVATFLYEPELVAANRKAWTEEWLAVMSR